MRKKRKREREKEGKRARKRQGLVVLGSGEGNPRVLLGDADQESEARMSKNALRTGRRQAVELLAEELNLNVRDNMKIADLSKLITTHPDYDEEFSKNLLTIIVEKRKLREQQEFEKERERLDREFRLEKLRLEN
ncbi:hypothetical protein TNCV_269161 [Trichonephila clavipes]|nr:hypothetical protein TNCV_269161 [Trichonephila clavipes]